MLNPATDYQCGCIGDNHPSCKSDVTFATEKPLNYLFKGTDVKMILQTDNSVAGSRVIVDWNCIATAPVTNTHQMATRLLTREFKLRVHS